jgi:hypothetical protein
MVLYLAQNVANGTKTSIASPRTCRKTAEKRPDTSAQSVTANSKGNITSKRTLYLYTRLDHFATL